MVFVKCCFKFKANEVNKNVEKYNHKVNVKVELEDSERIKKLKTEPTGSQIMIVNGTDIDLVPDMARYKQTGIFRINISKMLDRIKSLLILK